MKRQIRRGAFETNSSSTHAICISKKNNLTENLPKHLVFRHGEFGWEYNTYDDIESKASYLYEAICGVYNKKRERKAILNKLSDTLGKYGITCKFMPEQDTVYGDGYIDHVHDIGRFLIAVLSDSEALMRYLFGDSFIVTGNDNEGEYKERMYIYDDILKQEFDDYDVYEKGN